MSNFLKSIEGHTPGGWSFETPTAINTEREPKSEIRIYSDNGTHICDKRIITKCLPEHVANGNLISKSYLLRDIYKLLEHVEQFTDYSDEDNAYLREQAKQLLDKLNS